MLFRIGFDSSPSIPVDAKPYG
ncbi:hypothetical protein AVEN_92177-1, partial [Araneus ventricosus]